MKLIEAARVMAACRHSNRKRDTIRNDQLAVASGLCEKSEAVDLCHSLGLHAWATNRRGTDLKLMLEHIKRTGQSS